MTKYKQHTLVLPTLLTSIPSVVIPTLNSEIQNILIISVSNNLQVYNYLM